MTDKPLQLTAAASTPVSIASEDPSTSHRLRKSSTRVGSHADSSLSGGGAGFLQQPLLPSPPSSSDISNVFPATLSCSSSCRRPEERFAHRGRLTSGSVTFPHHLLFQRLECKDKKDQARCPPRVESGSDSTAITRRKNPTPPSVPADETEPKRRHPSRRCLPSNNGQRACARLAWG